MAENVDVLVKCNKSRQIFFIFFYHYMMKRRCRTCVVSRKRWNAAKLSLHPEKCSYERINRSLIRLTQRCIFHAPRSSYTSRASVCEPTQPTVMMTEMLEPFRKDSWSYEYLRPWNICTALFFFCWWLSHECNSLCLLKDSSSLFSLPIHFLFKVLWLLLSPQSISVQGLNQVGVTTFTWL